MTRRGSPARPASWLDDMPRRTGMEAGARRALPSLRHRRRQTKRGPIAIYTAWLSVPGYEQRFTTVIFEHRWPSNPRMFTDGPTDSPHRYRDRGRTRLCVWHPSDPPSRRWVPADGLLALFGMVTEHLFKEAWWREHDEWLGDEHPHGPPEAAAA